MFDDFRIFSITEQMFVGKIVVVDSDLETLVEIKSVRGSHLVFSSAVSGTKVREGKTWIISSVLSQHTLVVGSW